MTALSIVRPDEFDAARPRYQLRASGLGRGDLLMAIWQLPSPATPRLLRPECTATLKGRPLSVIESRLRRRLKGSGVQLPPLSKGQSWQAELDENIALNLALLFRTLAPMRSLDRIRIVAEGIDNMSREEAGYWLGMAVHRVNPRRVLAALRMLLTTT